MNEIDCWKKKILSNVLGCFILLRYKITDTDFMNVTLDLNLHFYEEN